MKLRRARCERCGEAIVWATVTDTDGVDKRVPLNWQRVRPYHHVGSSRAGGQAVDRFTDHGGTDLVHVSHFLTCSNPPTKRA